MSRLTIIDINKRKFFKQLIFTLIIFILFTNNTSNNYEEIKNKEIYPNNSSLEDLEFSHIGEILDGNGGSSVGNSNGKIDAGETILFQFHIFNTGETDLTDINITISTDDQYVLIIQNGGFFPYLLSQETLTSNSYYSIQINSSCPSDHIISFSTNVTDLSFTLSVQDSPEFLYTGYKVSNEYDGDKISNNNGIVDAGERVKVSFKFLNNATTRLYNLESKLSLSNSEPLVEIIDNQFQRSSLFAFTELEASFEFSVAGACPDKRKLNFTVLIYDDFNTSWSFDVTVVVNGTAQLEFVSYTIIDRYGHPTEAMVLDEWDYSIVFTVKNTGDAAAVLDWAFLTSDSPYIDFDYDENRRNESYGTYSVTKIDIGETVNITKGYIWEFELKSQPPHNRVIKFKLLLKERTHNIIYELEADVIYKREGYLPTVEMHPAMFALIILIVIMLVWNRRFIRTKINRKFWRFIKVCLIYGIISSIIVYLAQTYDYYFYMIYIGVFIFSCSCCVLYVSPASRSIKHKYRSWKADIYRKRRNKWEEWRNNTKSNRKSQKKQKTKVDKTAQKKIKTENFLELIAQGHDSSNKAQAQENKEKYEKAINYWNQAIDKYQKAVQLAPSKNEQMKIEEKLTALNQNLMICHVNNGLELRNQAMKKYKVKDIQNARNLYKEANKHLELGKEIKTKKNLKPANTIDIKKIDRKIQQNKNRLKVFDYSEELHHYNGKMKYCLEESKKDDKIVEIHKEINKILINIIGLEHRLREEKDTMFDVIHKSSEKLLSKARNLRKEIDNKFELYLGKISRSKIKDEGEEQESVDDLSILGLDGIEIEDFIEERKTLPEKDNKLLIKFKKIINISQEVEMDDVAESLRISEEELFERLIQWGEQLPFKIRGNLIVVNDLSAFMGALDKQFEDWENKELSKDGKK